MSQRNSEYARIERDAYQTPPHVTEYLLPHIPEEIGLIWEPAYGKGQMADVLARRGPVYGTDIDPACAPCGEPVDFLLDNGEEFCRQIKMQTSKRRAGIITNPPYIHAAEFCRRALQLTEPHWGFVAMLLKTDFDHAVTRKDLFADHPAWAKRIVLTKRIRWFEPVPGEKSSGPSENHAWFIWDWTQRGPATLAYAP